MKDGIQLRVSGDTAYVMIVQPDRRNALSWWIQHELGTVLARVVSLPDVTFVVIAGAGDTFSSGGDRSEVATGSLPPDWLSDYCERMRKTVLSLRDMRAMVIAAVRGVAVGAGASLALAADFVVAERSARFRFPFVHLGAVADAGVTTMIGRVVGPAVARDLLLTGRWLPAEEAHQRGLIARLCPDGELDVAVASLLEELRLARPEVLASVKQIIDLQLLPHFEEVVLRDGSYQRAAFPIHPLDADDDAPSSGTHP